MRFIFLHSNHKYNSDWKNITFTGTYHGELVGLYHNFFKIGMVSYNAGQNSAGDFYLHLNVTAVANFFSALRGDSNGYLRVYGGDNQLVINGSAPWTVGSIVFLIK